MSDTEVTGERPSKPKGRAHYWLSPAQERLADRVKPLEKYGCFHVESISEPGIFHLVTMNDRNGITQCECHAAFFGRMCWHRVAVHHYLSRLVGYPI